eukprot:7549424-Karenia_brevis.AAC.1
MDDSLRSGSYHSIPGTSEFWGCANRVHTVMMQHGLKLGYCHEYIMHMLVRHDNNAHEEGRMKFKLEDSDAWPGI